MLRALILLLVIIAAYAAFNSAVNRGLYESVASVQRLVGRAYALNNYLEFFAELTEAYFVRNDFSRSLRNYCVNITRRVMP